MIEEKKCINKKYIYFYKKFFCFFFLVLIILKVWCHDLHFFVSVWSNLYERSQQKNHQKNNKNGGKWENNVSDVKDWFFWSGNSVNSINDWNENKNEEWGYVQHIFQAVNVRLKFVLKKNCNHEHDLCFLKNNFFFFFWISNFFFTT